MVLWMLFSMLVPAATVIWKRGQQRFCWMEQNFVQCYSIFKLHHANKINVIIIQASWSNRTNKWLNWNSHKKIEGIVTSPVSQGAENNQIIHHFCALYCIHKADSGVQQSDNYGEIIIAPWLTLIWGVYIKQEDYLFVRFKERRIFFLKLKHLTEKHWQK